MPDHEPAETRLVGADRVLAVLIELAARPEGVRLDDLARALDSPPSTIHRALASLRRVGFARQTGRGTYLLGDEYLRLAFVHHEARPDHMRVQPALDALSQRYGETTHYAVLEDRTVVYRAKVDPAVGAIRLTSTVGGRNPAHCTAVGKVLLADHLPDADAVRRWVGTTVPERRTVHTITDVEALVDELATIRSLGYSLDREENELGVHCLALPVFFGAPSTATGAISISALAYRTPLDQLVGDVDTIRSIIRLSLDGSDPTDAEASPHRGGPS